MEKKHSITDNHIAQNDQESMVKDIRDQDGALRSTFVNGVIDCLEHCDPHNVKEMVSELHESDYADLLEILSSEQRSTLIAVLDTDFNPEVLSELEPGALDDVLEILPKEQIAEAVRTLDSDDAIQVLEDLDANERSEILEHIPAKERESLKRSLDYPEDSAGRLMQTEYVAFHGNLTAQQAIARLRNDNDLPKEFSAIYIVEPNYHLRGKVLLNRLLCADPEAKVADLLESTLHTITVTQDQEAVARSFQRYNLISAPVLDHNGRLVGVIAVDNIVDVIHEEAEEDIHALGGVGDESLADSVMETANARFIWLAVNLLTAILASSVIQMFDTTIEQMVALAVLMPIVASMGGNAATQTMTVAVRAIATKSLSEVNARRIIWREFLVGSLNGIIFAVIMGVITWLWFGHPLLGLVIGTAMVFNLIMAGLAGILIPLGLDRFGIDPAIASSVFVTTVTDVIGFFAFLGLAALVLV